MHTKGPLILLLLLVLGSCQMPLLSGSAPTSTSVPITNLLSTPGAPSPTPFQPNAPDRTSTPEPTPTPQIGQDGLPLLPDSTGQVNILVFGSDWRPGTGYRTDVILLVSLIPQSSVVSIVSFPRDLWITIPGIGEQRINTTQEYGGFSLTKAAFLNDFGLRIDHYVITNFNGFKAIIANLGGVDIVAATALYDRCDLAWRDGNHSCYVPAGPVHLDADSALWYVRSRESTSDFDRGRRAEEVLFGMFQKLMGLDAITRAPELFSMFAASIETDLSLGDITGFLPLVSSLMADSSKIHQYSITSNMVTPYWTSGGAAVQLPDYVAIHNLLSQALSGE